MTVLELIQRSSEFLAKRGVDSPRLQAELLLGHVLGVPRMKLYLDFERKLAETEIDRLREFVKRRGEREPLQHILGTSSFLGLELETTAEALIPRPETELLAEAALKFIATRPDACVLDFGTGSGCLAVTLAVRSAARVHALDISEPALNLARRNAVRHQVSDRIHFHLGDRFDALPPDIRFDLIVSNPPYIPAPEIATLDPEVRDHDPRLALDGGPDGLDFYCRLAAEGGPRLNAAGRLMVEFGDGQAEAVKDIFQAAGWQVGAAEADLSGRARILTARREA